MDNFVIGFIFLSILQFIQVIRFHDCHTILDLPSTGRPLLVVVTLEIFLSMVSIEPLVHRKQQLDITMGMYSVA